MTSAAIIRRHVWITGRVQGVGFRAATEREALRPGPGLMGFVQNLPDGRVEAVIQGEGARVNRLVAWCAQGPALACVESLEVKEEAVAAGLAPFGQAR